PNMPSYTSALLYPGTCLIEGTNVSEGRGTDAPFQMIGAPWIEGDVVAEMLNDCKYPGVVAECAEFAPRARKYESQRCSGVHLRITDAQALRSVTVGLALVGILARLYPGEMQWHPLPSEKNPR